MSQGWCDANDETWSFWVFSLWQKGQESALFCPSLKKITFYFCIIFVLFLLFVHYFLFLSSVFHFQLVAPVVSSSSAYEGSECLSPSVVERTMKGGSCSAPISQAHTDLKSHFKLPPLSLSQKITIAKRKFILTLIALAKAFSCLVDSRIVVQNTFPAKNFFHWNMRNFQTYENLCLRAFLTIDPFYPLFHFRTMCARLSLFGNLVQEKWYKMITLSFIPKSFGHKLISRNYWNVKLS